MSDPIEQSIIEAINNKTKPLGSLGVLEDLAYKISMIQGTLSPELKMPTIIVFAGDHGIADSGVSAFPKEVTYQMVLNFLNGGAAINVFTQQHGIHLLVVDSGVNAEFLQSDGINFLNRKIGKGTKNSVVESSMTESELKTALECGRKIAWENVSGDCNVIGFGEMGIGNTSSASLLMSALLDIPIEECTGKGTGLSDEALDRKIQTLKHVINRVKSQNKNLLDPFIAMQELGGFEIAMMVGSMLKSFELNRILLIDGFIATTSLLVASRINPDILKNCIFCHLSNEKAHRMLLNYLGGSPILNLGMRLGEGTGCAVAYPILESSVSFLRNMASFANAGVSDKI